MRRESGLRDFFADNGILCVNVLAGDQQSLSNIFAGRTELTMEQRFDHASWHTLETGAPALSGSIASLDTRITQAVEVGTHTIFLCEVVAIALGKPACGLVYFQRNYFALPSSPPATKCVSPTVLAASV